MAVKESEKLTYSIAEAAEVIGVSRPVMYQMIHREDFPTFRIGNRVLISRKGLAEWVDKQVHNTQGATL